MWVLTMIVVMLFVPGVAAVLTTKPSRPAPTVGPARGFVPGIVLAGGGLLVVSLFRDWWVFHATEYSETETANGGSTFVRLNVMTTALCTALTLLSL